MSSASLKHFSSVGGFPIITLFLYYFCRSWTISGATEVKVLSAWWLVSRRTRSTTDFPWNGYCFCVKDLSVCVQRITKVFAPDVEACIFTLILWFMLPCYYRYRGDPYFTFSWNSCRVHYLLESCQIYSSVRSQIFFSRICQNVTSTKTFLSRFFF